MERKTIDIFEIKITVKIEIMIASTQLQMGPRRGVLGQRGEKLVVKGLKVKIILA
jgi:hypothetical protein